MESHQKQGVRCSTRPSLPVVFGTLMGEMVAASTTFAIFTAIADKDFFLP